MRKDPNAVALGRKGGKSRSDAKARSSRINAIRARERKAEKREAERILQTVEGEISREGKGSVQ
jgi:hypothetical protein